MADFEPVADLAALGRAQDEIDALLRLEPGMRRALMLEVGMQNAGVGAKLAVDLFRDTPTVAVPPAAYAFGCMLTGTILVQVLMWREGGREGSGES